ncbi:hypothetical protein G6F34_012594 [Rhizopus arrhizus]|nr:hypothetical protein G6F34_012594 [Rhizopus arrhizus]
MNNFNATKIICTCSECSNHPNGFRMLAKNSNNNGEETVEYSSAIPELATEDGMNVDEEEGMSNEEQLRHLLLLFIVLFQAKHLSVKAGEDLLAFLSFFVRSLGHGMEIPTKISTARTMVNYSTASNGSSLKPVLEYPYNSIIETLKKFFMRPSFEQQIEQWRRRSVDEDVMFDIYDGRVWNQLVDSNGQVFTSQPRSLMVSLNVDWFQPSDNMKHSSGAIYLAINNLPRNTRMKFSNIVLAGVIPGPHEPNDDQIQNFLKPLN